MRKYLLIYLCILMLLMSCVCRAAPVAGNPRFDGKTPVGDDPIASLPLIQIQVTGSNVSYNTLVLKIDGVQVTTINPHNYSYDGTDFNYTVTDRLSAGWHMFTLAATDDGGPMIPEYSVSANVAAQGMDVKDKPLAIPNPATSNMRITYKLTSPGDVYLRIYNLNSELLWEREFTEGQAGAIAGYNEVAWDLRSGFGEDCPNGPYLCVIMKEEDGRKVVMEKLKLFILR